MTKRFCTAFLVVMCVAAAGHARAQQKESASIAGTWIGQVRTDAGDMALEVRLTVTNGTASGTITTAHGDLAIKNGTFDGGRWTLPFAGHGMEGRMIATVDRDTLRGEWINPAVASGTFELARRR